MSWAVVPHAVYHSLVLNMPLCCWCSKVCLKRFSNVYRRVCLLQLWAAVSWGKQFLSDAAKIIALQLSLFSGTSDSNTSTELWLLIFLVMNCSVCFYFCFEYKKYWQVTLVLYTIFCVRYSMLFLNVTVALFFFFFF